MPVAGYETIARNIIKYQKGFLNLVNSKMREVEKLLDSNVKSNISLTDHSLSDLRAAGHPYTSQAKAESLHTPYWQVHRQSGRLLSSKRSGIEQAQISGGTLKASAYVMLDPGVALHALYVVYGTSKMIPRPVMRETGKEVAPQAVEILKKGIRDLNFNFKGE